MISRCIVLAARPLGLPDNAAFEMREYPVRELEPGEFLIRVRYLSVDPYMRGRMNDAASYTAPYAVGEIITGGAVGEIVASRNDAWLPGDTVAGTMGWQEYAISRGDGLEKLDVSQAPVTTALGVLGMPGMTAYFGLLDVGRPVPGDTVVISAAAGAVGSVAGQIAAMMGCRVVGLAGRDEKTRYLRDELRFDAAINYNDKAALPDKLAEACPAGVDIYFDNVGGSVSDAVMQHLSLRARVVICGQIASYNLKRPAVGPRLQYLLIVKRARMEGFLVTDYQSRYGEARSRMASWIANGRLRYRETVIDGLENAPAAFLGLFRGDNIGKQLVRLT